MKRIIALTLALILALFQPITTSADKKTNDYAKPFKIRCTCYTWTGNRCANGKYPKEGLTVAGKKEWMGKSIVMYRCNKDGSIGKFIGYFEFCDTGYGIKKKKNGKTYGTIQAGESIDMYCDTLDGCYEWIRKYGDYVYIQIVDAEG